METFSWWIWWRCCLLFITSITTGCSLLDQLRVKSVSLCLCFRPFWFAFFAFSVNENLFLICLHVLDLHIFFFYCIAVFIFLQDKFEFHLSEMGGNQQMESGTLITKWRQDQDLKAQSDHQGGPGFGSVRCLWTWKSTDVLNWCGQGWECWRLFVSLLTSGKYTQFRVCILPNARPPFLKAVLIEAAFPEVKWDNLAVLPGCFSIVLLTSLYDHWPTLTIL